MPTENIIRKTRTAIDSRAALSLHREGKSLRQITEALAPGASVMAAARAIKRGQRQESVVNQIQYQTEE